MQPRKPYSCSFYSDAKWITLLAALLFFSAIPKVNAQTDTTIVDTVSMTKIDSLTQPDNDDLFSDTTVKHIYDTSQNFFNWKEYADDAFTTKKTDQRHLIDADVNELKTEEDFWYIPAIEKLETRIRNDPEFRDSLLNEKKRGLTTEGEKNFTQQPWFSFLLWSVIIIIFVAALIYFLLQSKINVFSKESSAAAESETGNEHENIFELSYNRLIRKAEKEQDYRVAVRLMFLQTIKLLSENGAIQYQPDYTNLYYLRQLYQSKLYNEFFKVMRNYEYVWYGKFQLRAEKYASVKNDFIILQNKIT